MLLPHARFPARVSPSVTDSCPRGIAHVAFQRDLPAAEIRPRSKSGAKLLNINKRHRAIATRSLPLPRFLSPQPIAREIYIVPFSYSAR